MRTTISAWFTHLGALLPLFILDLQPAQGQSLVSPQRLHNHLREAFSEARSFLQEENKQKTRRYIKHYFRSLSQYYITSLEEHVFHFMHEGEKVNGTNYLWILPGSRYGTSQDKLMLVGAHYDTRSNSPGVDDNGSGMAAMLEIARLLSDLDACNRRNSIGFVAFDWEEYNHHGSRAWLSDYFVPKLLPKLHLTAQDFQGAIILDTIMNWDDSPDSQHFPPDFRLAFPDSYRRLKANRFRGDFIMMSNRLDDEDIARGLLRTWTGLPLNATYRLEHISLPVSGRTESMPDIFDDFCRSDHCNFWNYHDVNTPKGLKAIFLTDTANYRGVMTTCHHTTCDELALIDSKKLEFLSKITETIIRYLMEVSTERNTAECIGRPAYRWLPTTAAAVVSPPSTTTTQSTPNPKPQTSSRAGSIHNSSKNQLISSALLIMLISIVNSRCRIT